MQRLYPTSGLTDQDRDGRIQQRDRFDAMLARARALPDADRVIVEHLLRHGLSFAQIARLLGSDRRAVARRAKCLLRRLNDPLFVFTVEHLDVIDPPCARIARAYVLHGLSLREVARVLDCTVHRVRTEVDRLRHYHHRHLEAQRKRQHQAACHRAGVSSRCASPRQSEPAGFNRN